ncbi:TlpA family protein disulfide reductase [Pedobacter insulae]|uniref:Thiol-disulfide isomerase or thioredoxin n=1 Tax=Pedobacter insulae TaxID=414048 RepID=A0A1I2YFH8_9SPHI|nr:TlpA disulfide reductase family protein [Pedobacter insulae]SFH23281.1 Thiol-disulfide isomerase or thioredoxin [Pedobacter insulae]
MKIVTLIFNIIFCIVLQTNAQQTEALNKRIQLMHAEKNPQKNIHTMYNIIKVFKLDTGKNVEEIDLLKGNVALSFLNAGNYTHFEAYIRKIKNKFNQTSFLNMAVSNLIKIEAFNYAAVLAKKTIELYESYKDDPSAKPNNFALEDWNRFMKMAAYPYYESYATVLHQKGQYKKALFYEEKALLGNENLLQSSIELYSALLVADGQTDKAYDLLLKTVAMGKASIKMTTLFKKLALQKLGSDGKVTVFLDSLQRTIKQQYALEVAQKMISNKVAPVFKLLDLNEKTVSLDSFKGKIVVLDFWATWCAPCVASMPAMKEISGRHPEVVFLYIATQETGIAPTTKVRNYVDTNKFPLNVLLDASSTTASAYLIKGIPTKVVIDRKGKIRFVTEGYLSDSELINELETMINLAKAQ